VHVHAKTGGKLGSVCGKCANRSIARYIILKVSVFVKDFPRQCKYLTIDSCHMYCQIIYITVHGKSARTIAQQDEKKASFFTSGS
jgi:hypothetical protein